MSQEILFLPAPPYDHKIAYGDDPNQFGYLRLPKSAGPHPVAIVIHGGFWRAAFDLEHSGHMCAALTRAGIATWSLEYRRIGDAGGGWPGTCEDVLRGASHLRKLAAEYPLNASRAVVVGHSAGGHLALWLAAQKKPRLRGVVSLAGVADLRKAWELKLSVNVVEEFMDGSPAELPSAYRQASPIECVPFGIPTRILHGDVDNVVPIDISIGFQAAASAAGDDSKLTTLPGADHFCVIDPRSPEWTIVEKTVLELI
ncbi:MAG TPA: prolyl oligopeptidase family serine peptidase [Bryobacteraceae bacterium]|jgi:acetyl esterase/lipase